MKISFNQIRSRFDRSLVGIGVDVRVGLRRIIFWASKLGVGGALVTPDGTTYATIGALADKAARYTYVGSRQEILAPQESAGQVVVA